MYSKIENEDREDIKHRKAQFLIYKSLKKADSVVSKRKKSSYWLKVKFCKLKIKIARKLKRLRKKIFFPFSSTSTSKV
ncbi:hypothetical protein MTR67_011355 [Solanum verrucosum]|uniref:Uncharacterized protein n=1 Tax=Solanum verrucosum TaxID=315347 RepID=A0AAF0QAV8_SOLVR|nr:hypothetical protein MTR67_011355 [Solanum verrucosum]